MIERLLKSWTRVPLIVDWRFPLIVDSRIGHAPASWRADASPDPWTALAQQTRCDLQADLQAEAAEHLVLHAVRSPARLIGRRFGDPLRDLDRLGLVERATLPVKGGFQTALGAALEPDVEGPRQDIRGLRRKFG